jgi:hypothetical protein
MVTLMKGGQTMDEEQLVAVRRKMRRVAQDHMSIVVLAKVVLDQIDGHLAKDGEVDDFDLAVTEGLAEMVVARAEVMLTLTQRK